MLEVRVIDFENSGNERSDLVAGLDVEFNRTGVLWGHPTCERHGVEPSASLKETENKEPNMKNPGIDSYSRVALPYLASILEENRMLMSKLASQIVEDVKSGRSLFVFGSGHSAILALELYHRAGGASFVIPVVADYLLPSAGPQVVRVLERTPGAASPLLARAEPREGEMIWIISQSGINAAVIDVAIEAKQRKLRTVAFTSVVHSQSIPSRHPSAKRLYEVCDEIVDLGGFKGDAALDVGGPEREIKAGPVSTLGAIFLGHSILVAATAELEAEGIRCLYTSVNTPSGEKRNQELESKAKSRDYLLR